MTGKQRILSRLLPCYPRNGQKLAVVSVIAYGHSRWSNSTHSGAIPRQAPQQTRLSQRREYDMNEPSNGSLVSLPAKTAPILRLNGLAPYYTMFPLAFPFNALRNSKPGDWVLDPFCGRGTTLLAARLRGLNSIGIDSNPVAVAIAAAKLVDASAERIIRLAAKILKQHDSSLAGDVPTGDFWSLCFDERTLSDICTLRKYFLTNCSSQTAIALRGLLLGILHGPRNKGRPTYLSNQMPRTYSTKPSPAIKYWTTHQLTPAYVDVMDAIKRRAQFTFSVVPPFVRGKVLRDDSRSLSNLSSRPKASWVVTSPPYYGMRTYFPDHWLRNWFVGGPSEVNYADATQLSHAGDDAFINDLASVWCSVAKHCAPNARLVCRFGALPSAKKDPRQLLRMSLEMADCGWTVTTIKNAGASSRGRRQCDQFISESSTPIDEIDLYAVLRK